MRRSPGDPKRARCALVAMAAAALVASPFRIGLAQDVPAPAAAQAPATPITSYVPEKDLVLFLHYEGTKNHPDAWRKTSSYKILNETTLGAAFEDVLNQLSDLGLDGPNRKVTREDVATITKHVLQSGLLVAAHGTEGKPDAGGSTVVYRDAFQPDVRPAFARMIGSMIPAGTKPKVTPKPGKRQVVEIESSPSQTMYWWVEKDRDLVIVNGKNQLDPVIATLEGQGPDITKHSAWQDLGRPQSGTENLLTASMIIPPGMPAQASQLGLDGIKRLDFRVALQDEAIINTVSIEAPAPRKGVLNLIDQPTFARDALPALPAGLNGFTVVSLDIAKSYDRIVAALRASSAALPKTPAAANGAAKPALDSFLEKLDTPDRRKQIDEFTKPLGTKFTYYIVPDAKAAAAPVQVNPANPMASLTALLKIKAVAVAEITDAAAFAKVLDKTMITVNKQFKDMVDAQTKAAQAQGGGQGNAQAQPQFLEFKKLAGVGTTRTYLMTMPTAYVALGATIKPTVKTGKSHVVFATAPDLAQQTLDLLEGKEKPATWAPADQVAKAFDQLPAKLMVLNVDDPREGLAATIQALPALLGGNMGAAGGMPGGSPIRLNPSLIPPADELKSRLFPGVTAVTVDEHGLRIVSRQSFFLTDTTTTGAVVALLMPAIQQARKAAREIQARNDALLQGLPPAGAGQPAPVAPGPGNKPGPANVPAPTPRGRPER